MRAPFAFFFPLGAALGLIGVSHWLLYGRGLLSAYNGQAHALVQVEGFLMAFACGFLCTMLPRHFDGAAPARRAVLGVGLCLVIACAASLASAWWLSQTAFLCGLLWLTRYACTQLGARMLHAPFVLLGFGLLCGSFGALGIVLVSAGLLPAGAIDLARALLQEGMFLGIVLGLGQFLFPFLMADFQRPRGGPAAMWVGLALLVASFVAQGVLLAQGSAHEATRAAQGLRCVAIAIVLLFGLRALAPPRAPGSHRIWIWLAFWTLPIGPLAAALWPLHRIALLHILFVGGFSLLAFSIAHQVLHAHGGQAQALRLPNRKVRVFGALFVFAAITRVSSDLLPESYWIHIEGAAAAWLVALSIWLWANWRPLVLAWRQSQ